MKVTIGICTWNRARFLDRTLTRMASLRIPAGVTWELLVANNNCTDDTDAVLARHANLLPLRRLFVEIPGKSNAANRIVAETTSELILWTDDDVLVEPEWLEAHVAAAERCPDVDIFAGRVLPDFERKPPRWIARNLPMFWGIFATCNYGPEPRLLKKSELPVGANMAVRRAVHLRFPFNALIGPQPGSQIRGEDTLLVITARDAGHRVGWVPDAVAHHHVPAHRMTYRYMRDYWRAMGAERILLAEQRDSSVYLFGIPRWLWKAQFLAWLKARFVRLGGRSPNWFRCASEAEILRGMAQQYRKISCNGY
jgi:glycosyltransferase involved in cell wall biosynthesis